MALREFTAVLRVAVANDEWDDETIRQQVEDRLRDSRALSFSFGQLEPVPAYDSPGVGDA